MLVDDAWQVGADACAARGAVVACRARACARPRAAVTGREGGCRRVAQHDVERAHVVDGHPVQHRPAAARVVADHAADRCPVARRRIGAEQQAVRGGGAVEVVLHHARLYARCPFLWVQLDDAVHVSRGIDDHRPTHRLSREAGARAARQHGHALLDAHRHRGGDVGGVAREHHRERLDAVHARVGGEEMARVRVVAHVAGHRRAQRGREVAHDVRVTACRRGTRPPGEAARPCSAPSSASAPSPRHRGCR